MLANPLLAALDDALECPQVAHLSRGDRLALALWWLIESVADEFKMPPEQAADEMAMLCGLARGIKEDAGLRINVCRRHITCK
jgi:hypothetical protein